MSVSQTHGKIGSETRAADAVRGQKVGSESIRFTHHTHGSRFPEQGPQYHSRPAQGYLETPDEVDARRG